MQMQLGDLRILINKWAGVINKSSQFSPSDKGAYNDIKEYYNVMTKIGSGTFDSEQVAVLAKKNGSEQNFLMDPPLPNIEKESPEDYRRELQVFLLNHLEEFKQSHHPIYNALMQIGKTQADISKRNHGNFNDKQTIAAGTYQKCVTEVYEFFTDSIGYTSQNPSNRTVFEKEIIDSEIMTHLINSILDAYMESNERTMLDNLISTHGNKTQCIEALKEINWKRAKDGMGHFVRAFNVLKKFAGRIGDDCYWLFFGPIGGEGKSVYCNGEIAYFAQRELNVYSSNDKIWGDRFLDPKPFLSTLTYIREDDNWSDQSIKDRKNLLDGEMFLAEQKNKMPVGIEPRCMFTGMSNKRLTEHSRRFQQLEYGRKLIGVDTKKMSSQAAELYFQNVSAQIYENLVNKKDVDYVLDVYNLLYSALQLNIQLTDNSWMSNIILHHLREKIMINDKDEFDENPTYIPFGAFINGLKKYKKVHEEYNVWSNEKFNKDAADLLKEFVKNNCVGTIEIGNTNDYCKLVGAPEEATPLPAIIIRNKKRALRIIRDFIMESIRDVNWKDEDAIFTKYCSYLWEIIDNGTILDKDLETIRGILNCSLPIK